MCLVRQFNDPSSFVADEEEGIDSSAPADSLMLVEHTWTLFQNEGRHCRVLRVVLPVCKDTRLKMNSGYLWLNLSPSSGEEHSDAEASKRDILQN